MPPKLDFAEAKTTNPRMNIGAQWAAQQDRDLGVFRVHRGACGTAIRGNPAYDLERAWGSLELFEQRVFEEQIVEHAMRLLE